MQHNERIRAELENWTATNLGQSLVEQEEQQLKILLANLYGPIAVQYGALGFSHYLRSSAAIHHIFAVDHGVPGETTVDSMLASVAEAMPFEARSVSVLLLPHVLEFSPDPHQVLREASRVLVPEGHLVITGFNPLSLWGIRRGVGRLFGPRSAAPWGGRFFGLSRVKDWVSVLGFEVTGGSAAYYLPPLTSSKFRQKLEFFQKAGERWWPMLAGTFILIARKRRFGMTPLVPAWRKKKRLTPGLAEPVTRNG